MGPVAGPFWPHSPYDISLFCFNFGNKHHFGQIDVTLTPLLCFLVDIKPLQLQLRNHISHFSPFGKDKQADLYTFLVKIELFFGFLGNFDQSHNFFKILFCDIFCMYLYKKVSSNFSSCL